MTVVYPMSLDAASAPGIVSSPCRPPHLPLRSAMIRRLRHRHAVLTTATLLSSLLCVLGPVSASAQEHRADSLLTVDKYLDFEQVAEPKLSPDGTQIVYTRRWVNKQLDRWDSALWIIGAD